MIPLCEATAKLFAPLDYELHSQDIIQIDILPTGKFIFDFFRINGNYRQGPSPAIRELIKRLPEVKPSTAKGDYYQPWEIAPTDSNCELISHHIPRERLQFLNPLAEQTFYNILGQSALSDSVSRTIAQYKLNKIVPHHEYELCADKQLAEYQQVALYAQQRSTGFGLFMEQGTGKTPIIIAAACNGGVEIKKRDPRNFYTVIIVCPNTVRANWESEFCKFATRGGRITTLRGTQIDRIKLLCDAFAPDETGECYYSVVITGYQTLWRSWEHIKGVPWDLACLDEAHNIKDSKAKQTRCCLELRDFSKQRAVLTGTPLANSVMDFYTLLEFMDKGGSGFSTEKHYKQFYGSYDRSSGFEVLVGAQNIPILQERLARKTFAITKKEALPDLPDKVYDVKEIEMTPQQAEVYKQVADELAVEIDNELSRDDITRQMIVSCILTKLLRLSQITSGFVSWGEVLDINGVTLQLEVKEYFFPNPKIDACIEDLLEITADKTQKAIIWAHWLPDVAYLQAACEQNDIPCAIIKGVGGDYSESDRQESVRRFNYDRDCQVCIGTAASGGSGLNLLGYPPELADEYDTDCVFVGYFSKNWSRIHRDQSEDRAHRKGTRRQVHYRDYDVPNSIDEQMRLRVMSKRQNAMDVGDLQAIMQAITNGI